MVAHVIADPLSLHIDIGLIDCVKARHFLTTHFHYGYLRGKSPVTVGWWTFAPHSVVT